MARHTTQRSSPLPSQPSHRYVEALEKIIHRDFFPDLPRLRAQHELLDALEAADPARAHRAHVELGRLAAAAGSAPSGSAAAAAAPPTPGGWTPASERGWAATPDVRGGGPSGGPSGGGGPAGGGGAGGGAGGGGDGTGVGLDKFLARHTSEDNASFAVEHAKDRVEHKRKYWWAFDAPGGDAPRLTAAPAQPRLEGGAAAQPNDAARLKALGLRTDAVVEVRAEAGSADAAPARRADGALVCAPAASGGGGGDAASSSSSTGALALAPSLAPARPYHKQGAIDRDERPSRLDYHHFSHHNALMFPPKAHPVQHPLTGPPAAMEHANTRFPAAAAAANEAAEAAAAGGGAAVGGAAAGAVEPGRAPPDLRGYSLVSAMPSPMPGAAGESPVMTWGAVVGTPQRLGDDFGGGTSAFAMAPPPPREQKANRLAADAARSLRARKGGGTPGGGGGSTPGELSAAGQRLARSLARTPGGAAGTMDSQLRASYGASGGGGGASLRGTPRGTPKVTPRATPTGTTPAAEKETPRGGRGATPSGAARGAPRRGGVTDGLLDL